MELMVIGIYGQPTKIFILVTNGLGYNNAHALSFYHEFYAQYMQLIKLYNIGSLVTMLVKNIGSYSFGEY
jgi:hypothetical protein